MNTITIKATMNGLDVWRNIYRERVVLQLGDCARAAIQAAHRTVTEVLKKGGPAYGINTGFGRLADTVIGPQDVSKLQRNVVLVNAIGSGAPLSPAETRLALAMKIASLAQGYSGVRLELVELMVEMFNRDLLPVIPCQGSVGASGDLTPLAHIAATMIGLGSVYRDGAIVATREAFASAGLVPLELQAKEGLALLNGTQISTALALAGAIEARQALDTAIVIGALTTEGVVGNASAFEDRVHQVRRQPGQIEVARRLRELMQGSEFREKSLREGRMQDPYCIRCQPQVYGACLDMINSVDQTLELEADAVTDNPTVSPASNEIVPGGNFHAEPVAFAADKTALAICELGSLSERRLALMTDSSLSGLPPFLTSDPGLNSGFMCAQVNAAAMVAENRQKAFPGSVDSVPTVVNYEDHVSMATHSARRLTGMVETLNNILAIELLAAVEACDFHGLELSSPLKEVKELVRSKVVSMNVDREFAPDFEYARTIVKSGAVARLVHG